MKEPTLEEELEALASHVVDAYERVRASTRMAIGLYGSDGRGEVLRDLFVVSLNVYGRSLVEFFDEPRANAHPDDVRAADYVPGWGGPADGADSLAMLKAFFVPGVNKRLAHITTPRVRSDAANDAWPVAEIFWSLACLMQHFIDRLPPARRLGDDHPQRSRGDRGGAQVVPLPWRLAGLILGLRWLRPLVDPAYRCVARNRHRLPGSTDACRMPRP